MSSLSLALVLFVACGGSEGDEPDPPQPSPADAATATDAGTSDASPANDASIDAGTNDASTAPDADTSDANDEDAASVIPVTFDTLQFGTTNVEYANDVAIDGAGNVIVVGTTGGALEGDNEGGHDVFVRKYAPDGTVAWTRQFGTVDQDFASGVAVDAAGNVVVVGRTQGALEGINAGGYDAFVRKYAPDGALVWTRQFGTPNDDDALGVAVDGAGNALVVGDTGGALEGASAGSADAFVRKIAPDGAFVWTKQFGTTANDNAHGIAVDGAGNVIVVGGTYGALEGANAGEADAFVCKVTSDGTLDWTKQFGTSADERAYAVAIDGAGNALAVGETYGALEGTHQGGVDAFARKIAVDGSHTWTRQFGTADADYAEGVAVDGAGNVIVAGTTEGALEGVGVGGADAFLKRFARPESSRSGATGLSRRRARKSTAPCRGSTARTDRTRS